MNSFVVQSIELIAWAAAMMLAVPVGVFCLECALAMLPRRKTIGSGPLPRGRTLVLIPAHDEQTVISATLESVMSALAPTDKVVVIADNCSDDTAVVARATGVTVWERVDPDNRGKGYALNFALEKLRESPPDVVVVVDADCRLSPGTIDALSACVERTQRPVQADNHCEAGRYGGGDPSLAALGHRFCCLIRPFGASRIGMPCSLMGTGMAFPGSLIDRIRFSGDHLAEDKLLGVDLTLAGHAPLFCPAAQVSSLMPQQRAAFLGQRRRWEHGHLRLAIAHVPRLVWGSIRQRRLQPLWMALDLSVPPLALLMLMGIAATVLATCGWMLGGGSLPLLILLGEGALLSLAIGAGWARFCRRELPLSIFLGIPGYLLRKVPLYASFFRGHGQREWVRTQRDPAQETSALR